MKKFVVLLLIAAVVLLSGCAQEKPEKKVSGITVTDMAGRTVTLSKPPEKVIVLTSYWAETLDLLGVGDKVVGIGNYVTSSGYVSDTIKSKPKVGSVFKGVNWETVVSLEPDLIITDWYGGKYKDEEIIKRAGELGIQVVALQAKSVEDNIKCVEILGKVFGREDKAKEIVGFMEEKLNAVKEMAKKAPKKKVLVISAPKDISGPISVYAKGSAWGSIPELIGAHNVAYDREFETQWPKVDLEKILTWWENVDVIVVISYSEKKLNDTIAKIKSDERWQKIKAVKDGNVYGILAGGKLGHFLDWGPRIVVGVYQFGYAVYPDYYPKWQDVAQELLKFYGKTLEG